MPTATRQEAPGKGANGASKAPVPTRAFRVGVQSHDEINYDETRLMTAGSVDFPVLNVPPAGFLRGLLVKVEAITAGNAAATAFTEDGPFIALDTVTLEDVNSAPIVGPINGFDLYVINKYGGYTHNDDPRSGPRFLATTGAGATGGSFRFFLRIPVELVNRDALGSLPNKSGTAMYKLRLRLSPSATIYATAPTALPNVNIKIQQVDWWDPDATDLRGRPLAQNPPAVQTTQYWIKNTWTVPAGAMRQQLERVGYLIRNLIFILEDTAGARSVGETDFPDPFTLLFEANILVQRLKDFWTMNIVQNYGYGGTTFDTVGSRDNGVFVEPFCLDFALKPGSETRRGYLPTSAAARLEAQGNIGGAGVHTLTVLTNDVAPARDEAELVV